MPTYDVDTQKRYLDEYSTQPNHVLTIEQNLIFG